MKTDLNLKTVLYLLPIFVYLWKYLFIILLLLLKTKQPKL